MPSQNNPAVVIARYEAQFPCLFWTASMCLRKRGAACPSNGRGAEPGDRNGCRCHGALS
jgi:hypothetical protein